MTKPSRLSDGFLRLYCDPAVFGLFSAFHPINFSRVLPFQSEDPIIDDQRLIVAEEAHLADRTDDTRVAVIDAYVYCRLLPADDANNVKSVIDSFGTDFFDLMGLVYANAGMFICALRWYRELIQALETRNPNSTTSTDTEEVYASVGYCLYSLGLYAEAISWSKSCMGPRYVSDAVGRAVIAYQAQLVGANIRAVERSGPRTRYILSTLDPAQAPETTLKLKAALEGLSPSQEVYIDWVREDSPSPALQPDGYPFSVEADASSLPRHKMNLLCATCAQADLFIEKGFHTEAKQLLSEALILEPESYIVAERLKSLPQNPDKNRSMEFRL